jgi:hypothetical protein
MIVSKIVSDTNEIKCSASIWGLAITINGRVAINTATVPNSAHIVTSITRQRGKLWERNIGAVIPIKLSIMDSIDFRKSLHMLSLLLLLL